MILAAGFGTRLKPITETLPKALVIHKGKTLLETQIEKLKALKVKEIIINTHHHAQQIEQYIANYNFKVPIKLINEKDILGTGGAVINAKEHLKDEEYFVLLNVDIDSDMDINKIVKAHKKEKPLATLAVHNRESKRKLEFDKHMNLVGRQHDNSDPDRLFAFNGLHVISSKFFEVELPPYCFDIIDCYNFLTNDNTIKGYEYKDVEFKDIGKIENLKK